MTDDELVSFLNSQFGEAVSRGYTAIHINCVPEDREELIRNWSKKKEDTSNRISVSYKMTESGLTTEEEDEFEDQWNLELSDNSNDLSEDEEKEFELRWRSKPVYEQLGLAESMIAGFKEVLCNKIPDAQEPKRLKAKIRWWQRKKEEKEAAQKRFENVLKRKNDHDNESAEIRRKHGNIGKGKRKHRNPLNAVLDRVDQYFKEDFRVLTYGEFAIKLKNLYKKTEEWEKFDPDRVIIDLEDENASIRWKKPNGEEGKPAAWSGLEKRLDRIRKARIQLISATGGLIPEKS
jgi:hypothetical protein